MLLQNIRWLSSDYIVSCNRRQNFRLPNKLVQVRTLQSNILKMIILNFDQNIVCHFIMFSSTPYVVTLSCFPPNNPWSIHAYVESNTMNLNRESVFCVLVMLVYIPHKVILKKLHHHEGLTWSSLALQYVILMLFTISEVYVVPIFVLLILVCIICLVMSGVMKIVSWLGSYLGDGLTGLCFLI
jgi:hypothetical protein